MKNSKGISLISLVVTIIVIIILAAIGIRVATSGIDSAIEARTESEKKELETAIIKRFSNYALNKNAYPLIGSTMSVSELGDIDQINAENIEYIRKVNTSDLQSLGIKNTTGSTYVVDYFAGAVYGPVQ